MLLASRRRWALAGTALGVGAALKWTPALSVLALAAWLLRRKERRAAVPHALAAATACLLVNLPFLITSPSAVTAAYRIQRGRGISAESMFYVPPVVGLTQPVVLISHDVGAPRWANIAAGMAQALVTLGLIACAARARKLAAAVAVAGLAPVVFLLMNRVFSPQYLVTALAAWAVAAALLELNRREQLLLIAAGCAATVLNVLVYPTGLTLWPTLTLGLFALAFSVCGFLLWRSFGPRSA